MWALLWPALMALLMATAAHCAAPPEYTQVALRELPHEGALSEATTSLAQLAAKYRKLYGADYLLVYLWEAGEEAAGWSGEEVPDACSVELQDLANAWWDRGVRGSTGAPGEPGPKIVPISVIVVYAKSEQGLARLCGQIQREIQKRAEHETGPVAEEDPRSASIPLYAYPCPGSSTGLIELVTEEVGAGNTFPPALLLLSATDLQLVAARGREPVRAYRWLEMWLSAKTRGEDAGTSQDPNDVPADCTGNWFRRQIARVVRAGVMPLKNGLFQPAEPVTYAEYIGWLDTVARINGRRPPARNSDPLSRPIQRGEAIAATARLLWGDDPAAALAACPPPPGLRPDAPDLWQRAFHGIPGWQDVPTALAPYLILAQAEGLLYDQPALRPVDDLTREEAAWLLDRALASGREGMTGIVVDVVDVPFVVDAAGASSRGASLEVEEAGKLRTVYPQNSTVDRLPYPEPSFTPVLCVPYDEAQQPGSKASQWLASRVGDDPLRVRAVGVVGEPRRGRQVRITPEDAKALRALNQGSGALDHWRVAFLYGAGARLLTPLDGPVGRETTFAVRFSQEMSKDTASSDHVWLRRAGAAGAKVAAAVEWRELGRELAVRPKAPLAPNQEYEFVLATDIRSARGEPIAVRDGQLGAQGVARCWRFTTDPRLLVYVGISGVPDGTKVYLPDRPGFLVTPLSTSPLVMVKPGLLEVRFETPDGGSLTQSQQVAGDGAIRMPTAPSRPSLVRVEGVPAEVAPGQPVTLTFRAEDAAGGFLPDAVPLTVKAQAKGCLLSPGPEVSLERGEAHLQLQAEKPGKVIVTLSSSDMGVPVRPAQIVTYCRYPSSTEAAWSPAESHLLSPVARGARDVQITPRFRRWLAIGSANEVRVVDREGNGFSRIPQVPGLPSSREFWVDDLGVLHFDATAAGTVVDLSYQYRRPRGAAVVLGLPEGDSLAKALEAALSESLQDLGYEEVAAAELAAAWDTGDAAAHLASAEGAQTAMGVLGLTDLFVLTLDMALDGGYQGVWTIWTAESGQVMKWPPADPEAPAMHLRRGRRAEAAEARYARREVMQSLRPWLAQKGMEPSHTLVAGPSQGGG